MKYKNVEISFIQLVTYMGDEFKDNTSHDNQTIFKNKIRRNKFPYNFSFECPIEDMICINIDDVSGFTKEGRKELINALNELKKIYGKSFINLSLDDFIDGEGNCIDLTEVEFLEILR